MQPAERASDTALTESKDASVAPRLNIAKLLSPQLIRQFLFYTVVGAVATAVDWGSFYGLNQVWGIDYKIAVSISFTLGATTNYILNKFLTFRDKTRQIAAQLGVYIGISLLSLVMSVGLMYLQVDIISVPPMAARIITTGVMLFANFFMHKFITFNRMLYDKVFGSEK